jgi:hypothetical protein
MVRLSQVVHVLHGLTSGFLWWVDWRVSLFLFLQFFVYEYFEETKVKDEMYRELKEWSSGFAVALVTVLLVKSLFRTICI